jgi:hypothetical protein
LSDSGYTNKDICLLLHNHIIKHTNASLDKPSKVLLINRHGSHIDLDFIIKATVVNVHPYPFPIHLTHILQLLNVSVFQPYKISIQRQFNMQYVTLTLIITLHPLYIRSGQKLLKREQFILLFKKLGFS